MRQTEAGQKEAGQKEAGRKPQPGAGRRPPPWQMTNRIIRSSTICVVAASIYAALSMLTAGVGLAAPPPTQAPQSCWDLTDPVVASPDPVVGGQAQRAQAALSSRCDAPVTVSLTSGHASTGGDGQLTFASGPGPEANVGLDSGQIRLTPGQRVAVPLTLTAHPSATPGEKPLAVSAESADGQRQWRTVTLTVLGTPTQSIEFEQLGGDYSASLNPLRPGSATVDYVLRNTGNTVITGNVYPGLDGLYGQQVPATTDRRPITLVPGAAFHSTLPVPEVWPGIHFTIRAGFVPTQPPPGQAQEHVGNPIAVGDADLWAVPIGQILGVAVLGAALFAAVVFRHRRRLSRRSEPGREEAGTSDLERPTTN